MNSCDVSPGASGTGPDETGATSVTGVVSIGPLEDFSDAKRREVHAVPYPTLPIEKLSQRRAARQATRPEALATGSRLRG